MASLRLIVCALALAGCYELPEPACGFQCGPPLAEGAPGECPSGYTCVAGRCQTDAQTTCPPLPDAPGVTDLTPPGVMARSPAPGETGVALDATVTVTFDEPVTSVNPGSFGLSTDTGFVLAGVTEEAPGRTFRLTPERPLRVNKTYQVILGIGIADLAGNALRETTWTFSTIEDRTGPMIASADPADGAVDVALTAALSIRFDEPVTGVTDTSARLEQGGMVQPVMLATTAMTIDLEHDPLTPATTYSIVLTSDITDLVGNPLAPTTITFTTAP